MAFVRGLRREMSKVDEITQIIGRKFRSFGGGQTGFNNPLAIALKDQPLLFAAGVDIKSVVGEVLSEDRKKRRKRKAAINKAKK